MPLSPLAHGVPLQRRELPDDLSDIAHKKRVAGAIDAISRGAVNWVVEFTLATGVGSTTVKATGLTVNSQVSLQALDANAAALLPQVYIPLATMTPGNASSGQQVGQFVVNHPPLTGGTVASYRASVKG